MTWTHDTGGAFRSSDPVPPTAENPYSRDGQGGYTPTERKQRDAWKEGFAAGRAALPDPPTDNPYINLRGTYEAERRAWDEGWAAREAAALPDERLREADRRVILEWAKFTRDESMGYWGKEQEAVYDRLLAAADREKPEER